jgi:hypothetical protein
MCIGYNNILLRDLTTDWRGEQCKLEMAPLMTFHCCVIEQSAAPADLPQWWFLDM